MNLDQFEGGVMVQGILHHPALPPNLLFQEIHSMGLAIHNDHEVLRGDRLQNGHIATWEESLVRRLAVSFVVDIEQIRAHIGNLRMKAVFQQRRVEYDLTKFRVFLPRI